MGGLTIGKLAKACGLRTDTLRYYERLGLIQTEGRKANGYRVFLPDSVMRLQFIHRAKLLNFTLEEIKDLLLVRGSPQTNCEHIYERLQKKIGEIDAKIDELTVFKCQLQSIAKKCPRGTTSLKDCSLMDFLDKPSPCCEEKPKPHSKKARNFGKISIAILTLLTASFSAQAKPISYVDGVMVMQENDETGHTLSFDYTIAPNYAIGWYDKWEDNERNGKDFSVHGPEFNTLIKRWNLADGQANIFNSTGAGIADGDHKIRGAAWTSILADYETRRIFTSYEIRGMFADDINLSQWQRARVGVAPYLAGYDDVATWFMIQGDYHPSKSDTFVATPLVRVFYKGYLAEVGYSTNHRLMFNWDLQF